jgi:fermentation-respiration switch protein FrsA (DUF1100 family)
MNTTLTALIALAVLILIAVALILNYQHRQIFKPERARGKLHPDPSAHGIDFEDVYFSGAQGQRLHGWWLPCDPAAGTLLFCHGNRGNLSDRTESCAFYRRLGLNVFAFDYRGYGHSPGRPTEAGLYADAAAAWRYLRDERGVAADEIVVLGRSLGGAVASHLANQVRPAAVVIESTFTSIRSLARELYPRLPHWGLDRIRFDNAKRIGDIDVPLLLVHSTDDQVIGFHHGETLASLAHPQHRFVTISGAHSGGHLTSGDTYTLPLREFLNDAGLRLITDEPGQGATTQRSV